ncbi:hypothetical protein [Nocardiopsis sp. SBT366]|uniref:hypothetical protein n=1 Tax=Nocardiopsis sp. SBT366 TaxID=1580529 RepID=UPI00066D15BA|nr:hypothetical protein [Nocardiopsis sp. SBT366]
MRTAFARIAEDTSNLWAYQRRNDPVWSQGFQKRFSELMRTPGNRHGFLVHEGECEIYGLRCRGDGFSTFCFLRSEIQIIIDEFVPYADLVHPEDVDSLDILDDVIRESVDDIVPLDPGEAPSWVPESHWWWRAPTRHDWTQREIDEKLYDYYVEDWETP